MESGTGKGCAREETEWNGDGTGWDDVHRKRENPTYQPHLPVPSIHARTSEHLLESRHGRKKIKGKKQILPAVHPLVKKSETSRFSSIHPPRPSTHPSVPPFVSQSINPFIHPSIPNSKNTWVGRLVPSPPLPTTKPFKNRSRDKTNGPLPPLSPNPNLQ